MRDQHTKIMPPKSGTKISWRLSLATIVLLSIFFIFSNWATISTSGFEVGDFAANSLLIQEAKSFGLFVGNYSRVGFNHPGPAILYVLAAGEFVFYDALKLVPSPVGGQLLAVGIYSACWLAALLTLLARFSASRTASFFSLALFIFAASLADFQFFTGMWFPHLYFLPFAVMLMAASRLASGRTDSLVALAVSSGFLINGHVSFVPIVGIILAAAVGFNFSQSKFGNTTAVLSKSFLRAHTSSLGKFIGIGFIFLIPLLIQTFLKFPGPIAEYASFGGQHKPNSIIEGIVYVSLFWGGVLPMLTGLTLIVVLAEFSPADEADFSSNTRSLAAVLLSATFALWFYARYGIDMLDHKYIGLFYYSVPIIALVVAAAMVLRHRQFHFKNLLLILFCTLLSAGTYILIKKPATYAQQYANPEVAEIYKSLNSIQRSGRLVLDQTTGEHASEIWRTTLGVLAYAKRENNNFICINKNWHISFTAKNRCTPDEVFNGRHLIVYHRSDASKENSKPYIEAGNLAFFEFSNPTVIGAGEISVSRNGGWFDAYFLQSGWSPVEKEFVWSQAREAKLLIPITAGFSGRLTFDIGAYVPTPDSRQEVEFEIDGVKRRLVEFTSRANRQEVNFDISRTTGELLDVKLTIRSPISPSKFGSSDNRKLGVSLYGFQVTP